MNIEANFARRRIALGILLASSCLSPAYAQDQSAPSDPVDVGQADPAAANPTAASEPGAPQAAGPGGAVPAEDDSAGGIGEIVVTAQKRTQNVQDVPIAVSAFGSEALEERAVASVAQLSQLTPNVTLDSSVPFSGSTAVLAASIRGIGSNDFAFNIDPGVGVYLDGVYLARSVGANQDLLDVARIAYAADLAVADLGSALERLLATGAVPESFDGSRGALAGLKDMTSRLVGRFVRSVEEATREAHGQGALVRHEADLIVPVEARAECAVLKAVAAHFVMNVRARLEVQAGEREVINALVAAYRADPGRLDRDLRADHDAATSEEEVLRVVIDQVASLTDTRARHLHRAWS